MVYMFITQLTKSLFGSYYSFFIIFDSVDNIVVGYAALNHIIY